MKKRATKKKAQAVECDCLGLCNEALAKDGVEVDTYEGIQSGRSPVFVQKFRIPVRFTKKLRKKRKLPNILCTFCPVCGVRLCPDE